MKRRFFGWLVDHRALVLGFGVLCVIAAGLGATRVGTDYNVEEFFPLDSPARQTYERYRQTFPREDTQVSVFWKEGAPLDVEAFGAMGRLAGAMRRAGLRDITWIGSARTASLAWTGGQTGLELGPLVDQGALTDASLLEALQHHRDNPLYVGSLWDESQQVYAIHGYLPLGDNNPEHRAAVTAELSERLSELEESGRELVLSGMVVVRAQALEAINSDLALFLGLGVLVIALLLYLVFRRIGQVALCLVAVMPAYLATLAVMGALGVSVSMLTSIMPIIVLVVGVSDTVHVVVHVREERRRGAGRRDTIVGAFSGLCVPCAYTSLTTAIGFSSLASTGIDIVVEFGLFTALGVVFTYAFTMLLMPALLSLRRAGSFEERGALSRVLSRLVSTAQAGAKRRRPWIALASLAVAVGAIALGSGLRVNAHMMEATRRDHPIIQDSKWIEAHGFGLFQVNLWVVAEGADSIGSPEMMHWMDALQRYAEREPTVLHTASPADVVRALPAAMAHVPARIAAIGEQRFLDALYRPNRNQAQVVLQVRDSGSALTVPFLERLQTRLREHPPPGAQVETTGTVVLTQSVYQGIVKGFGSSVLLAAMAIFLIMAWMFRSPLQGLVALIPNVFPLLVLLGAMGLLGWELKPSTMLVFAIAFGLAVDDTIHLLGRVHRLLREGLDVDTALRRAIATSGRAIIVTSLVIAAGFALLLGSQLQFLYVLGVMTIVSAVAALVANLYLYPQLLRLTIGLGRARQTGAIPHEVSV